MRGLQRVLSYSVVVLVLSLVALPVAATPRPEGTVHVVQPGESLTSIAQRYGTTPQAIARANNLVSLDVIYVGQRLTIPTGSSESEETDAYYTVRGGDTLSGIAAGFGVTLQALVQANRLPSADRIYAGERLVVPGGRTLTSVSTVNPVYYTVQQGDSVSSIAARQGLPAWAIVQANQLTNPSFIYVGQRLVIPARDTTAALFAGNNVYYTVQRGDSVSAIAVRYAVPAGAIVQANDLANPDLIYVGQRLLLPGGTGALVGRYVEATAPAPADAPRGSGNFMWPVSGYVTQGYSSRHRGIDIGAPTGTPVHASDAGYVSLAGWRGDYGNYIIVNHGNGFETVYAHLSQILVVAGQVVQRGEVIGLVGSTGRSTGPHLHFELRQGGVSRPW